MGVRSAGKNRQGHVVIPVVFPLKTGGRQGLKTYQIRIKDVSKTFTGVPERCLPGESAVPFPGRAAFPSLFPVVFPVFPVKFFLPNVLPVTVLVGGLKKR